VAGIQTLINEFFCSESWTVNPETLAISHPAKATPSGLRVVLRRGRYRFERVAA
jgi:hypothetical protein